MSEHEWKPGDVAAIPFRRSGDERAMFTEDGWVATGWPRAAAFDYVGIRPLVVVDPEDREQVERLACAYAATVSSRMGDEYLAWGNRSVEARGRVVADLQVALREFATPTPPRPEEPTGLGAVVECDPGPVYDRAWAVRVWAGDDFGGKAWDFYDSSGNGGRAHYAELAAVRVLSEGVR